MGSKRFIEQSLQDEYKEITALQYVERCCSSLLEEENSAEYRMADNHGLKITRRGSYEGGWHDWHEDKSGRSAVSFIMHYYNESYMDALNRLVDEYLHGDVRLETAQREASIGRTIKPKVEKKLVIPARNENNKRVYAYLKKRGLDTELIDLCLRRNLVYEDKEYHNCCFVGYDMVTREPKYINKRSTLSLSNYRGDQTGSDKRYSFRIVRTTKEVHTVHLFECAIDLLSYMTLYKGKSMIREDDFVSLAGVSAPKNENNPNYKIPLALESYLNSNPNLKTIYIHFDNDKEGRGASRAIKNALEKKYTVVDEAPPKGKDFNDTLCIIKGLKKDEPER